MAFAACGSGSAQARDSSPLNSQLSTLNFPRLSTSPLPAFADQAGDARGHVLHRDRHRLAFVLRRIRRQQIGAAGSRGDEKIRRADDAALVEQRAGARRGEAVAAGDCQPVFGTLQHVPADHAGGQAVNAQKCNLPGPKVNANVDN